MSECKCECKCERKTDRRCNNCGERLTEHAPNWFQCSEACRQAVWDRNNPPKHRWYDSKDNESEIYGTFCANCGKTFEVELAQ